MYAHKWIMSMPKLCTFFDRIEFVLFFVRSIKTHWKMCKSRSFQSINSLTHLRTSRHKQHTTLPLQNKLKFMCTVVKSDFFSRLGRTNAEKTDELNYAITVAAATAATIAIINATYIQTQKIIPPWNIVEIRYSSWTTWMEENKNKYRECWNTHKYLKRRRRRRRRKGKPKYLYIHTEALN